MVAVGSASRRRKAGMSSGSSADIVASRMVEQMQNVSGVSVAFVQVPHRVALRTGDQPFVRLSRRGLNLEIFSYRFHSIAHVVLHLINMSIVASGVRAF
jgi:hypothetical protein